MQQGLQGFAGIAFSLDLRGQGDANFRLSRLGFEYAKSAIADQLAAREEKNSNLIPASRRARLDYGQASDVRLNDVDRFRTPRLEPGHLGMSVVGKDSWAIARFEIAKGQPLSTYLREHMPARVTPQDCRKFRSGYAVCLINKTSFPIS